MSCKVILHHILSNSTTSAKVVIKLNGEEIFSDSIAQYGNSYKQTEFNAGVGDILDIQYSGSNSGLIGGFSVLSA